MFESTDYLATARTRYTDQFKDAVNFDILMIVWMFGYQDLQDTLISMIDIKDVDKARGVQLDVIGDIVGQPRTLEQIDATGFFGFYGDSAAKSFGSLDNSGGGLYNSLYSSDSFGTISLPDSSYRAFIKTKILSNNAGGTAEEIITATQALFSVEDVELIDDGEESGVFTLNIGRKWNDDELSAFPGLDETAIANRLLPKPAGVRIGFIDERLTETLAAVNAYSDAIDYLFNTVNVDLYDTIGDDKF